MREMHKWKDKVELSLDNRQIFFLFFGLSVIGCFVFALGIMTGRRIQWEPGQEVAAVGGQDSLALLEGEAPEDEHFAFQRGLSESDAEAIPPTRDPAVPPRDEGEVRAERAEAADQAANQAASQAANHANAVADAASARAEQRAAENDEVDAKIAEQQQALAHATPAAAQAKPASSEADGTRRFTLQMKAFSRQEDADKLAATLRHNGHDVRIESHDVRGRSWHRVRLGTFDTWDEALAAKQTFEKAEKVIAYVVSL
ncbi:SPOR domain-containing protein [Enhygromyxa salina]|uniref:Cell division protein FtsN n=1 Tax=Enhygromyxa salina TaxID=215803 RepID=A0A2S9XZF8_9BACT|nr:SPOR domain-containing protein [Enhygromyxa salina]PRP98110.1 cell division protein FtsN [Enhygromyxa salina]